MCIPREKAKMVLLHASGINERATEDEYHQRHPWQPRPSLHLTGDLTCIKENGSVQDKPRTGCPRSATGLAKKVTASPQCSTQKIAQESAIGRSSVHHILQWHKFHPYKTHIVQELHGDDTDRCLEFCEWFSQTWEQLNTLEVDEACFHLNGTVNRHNLMYWSDKNPPVALLMLTTKRTLKSMCGVASMAMLL
jgi:hypothetical protein